MNRPRTTTGSGMLPGRALGWGLISLALLAGGAPIATAESPPLVLRDVTLVPMTSERVVEGISVLVEGGLIAAIGRRGTLPIPPGATTVEADGAYLVPGLVEMHTHLRDRMSLDLFLGHGVTMVRNMDGTPQVLEWRSAIERGELRGPALVTGSPFLHRYAGGSPERHVASVDDALRLTRRYHRMGYDYIKIAEIDDEPFFALMEEAGRLGIPVVGHVPNYDLDLEKILNTGMASIEHVEELFRVYFDYRPDAARIPAFVDMVRRAGVPLSTLVEREVLLNGLFDEGEAYLTPDRLAWVERYSGPRGIERVRGTLETIAAGDWDRHPVDIDFLLRLVRELHRAGVVIVPGTDSGGSFTIAGFGLHTELEHLRRAGLSPYETLRAATVNAARVLGLADRQGTIEVGKRADLLLVRENPLHDLATLRQPTGLVLRGDWLDETSLEALRQRRFEDAD